MKRSCIGVVVLLCSFIASPHLLAQGRIQIMAPPGFAPAVEADGDPLEAVRQSLQHSVNVNIADIDRACDLTEDQLKKLEVAGKGAIVQVLELEQAQREQMQAQMGAMNIRWAAPAGAAEIVINGGGVVIEGAAPEMEVIEEDAVEAVEAAEEEAVEEQIDDLNEAEIDLIDVEPREFLIQELAPAFGFGGQLVSGAKPEDQEIWINTLDRTLTDEQKAAYESHINERQQFQREAAVSQFMFRVDNALRLSAEQRSSLSETILEHYGENLRLQMTMNDPANWNMIDDMALAQAEEVDTEAFTTAVSGILNDDQDAIWTQQFETELMNVWIGAPLAAPVVPGFQLFNEPIQIEIDDNGG